MSIFILIGIALLGVVGGACVGFFVRKRLAKSKVEMAEEASQKVLQRAKKEAETIKKEARLQAKEDLYKAKADFEKETRERRLEVHDLEKRMVQREENLDKKVELIDQKEDNLSKREKGLAGKDFEQDYVHIHSLYILPGYRKQGHATAILQKAIKAIRKKGYTGGIQIVANPTEDGISAEKLKSFYKSLNLEVFEYYG